MDAGIEKLGYTHERRSQRAAKARGEDPGKLLPGVHRIAALVKRWLLGTHQSSVDPAHLQNYLNEFVFRFNDAARAPAACSSTASCNSRSHTHPCATATWSPTRNPSASRHGRRPDEAIRRAWTVHSPTAPGARFQAR